MSCYSFGGGWGEGVLNHLNPNLVSDLPVISHCVSGKRAFQNLSVGSACPAAMSPLVIVLSFPLRTTLPPDMQLIVRVPLGVDQADIFQNGNLGQSTQSQTMVGEPSPTEVFLNSPPINKEAGWTCHRQTGDFPRTIWNLHQHQTELSH